MAQPPVKRRIQPQLISPLVNGSSTTAFTATTLGGASSGLVRSSEVAFDYVAPGPKEDSEYAAQNGMKGRRMLVELNCPSKEINFKKVSACLSLLDICAWTSVDYPDNLTRMEGHSPLRLETSRTRKTEENFQNAFSAFENAPLL
jgi:hypothetical protein